MKRNNKNKKSLFAGTTVFSFLIITLLFFGIKFGAAAQKVVPAPEFSDGTAWFNVAEPLSMKDLKGKVVLIDFWTYCCINCMHVIPDLKKLEAKYPHELAVIGVHSGKFNNEREVENIRQAVLRYEIEHPVVADSNFLIWNAYGVRAWPTLVLIDPEGNIVGSDTGEGHYEILDKLIGKLISEYRSKNLINDAPLPMSLEREKYGPGILSFPGKILADEAAGRLYIADTNHNRIVISSLAGEIVDIAGNGVSGNVDGSFEEAGFKHPQGMALQGKFLYVADTGNHIVRKLDLEKRTVSTIAGTGKQAGYAASGGMGTLSPMNSPWDLVILGNKLYIAMAGVHQIWEMDLESAVFKPYAGSGREGCIDGVLDRCALAQPSGIAVSERKIFFADSEVSAIRYVDLEKGMVRTVVGKDLFVFGDVDGKGDEVRLQHPLGVTVYKGIVYVADTYNHKIKVIDPETRECKTYAGIGTAGFKDGPEPQFYEPGGLAIANEKLYVADTNNHAIRVVDMKTREVRTLRLKEHSDEYSMEGILLPEFPGFTKMLEVPIITVNADTDVEIVINLKFPAGYHLNPYVPLKYSVENSKGIRGEGSIKSTEMEGSSFLVKIPDVEKMFDTLETEIKVSVVFYYCREDNQGGCFMDAIMWKQPVKMNEGVEGTAFIYDYEIQLPTVQQEW
ncbi:MAG: redoxin domain-containing protein [Candidatus Kuenenia sp.]|nr:redoxin domain-containing protein [Candidatus Kuenenia hertensis]